MAFVNKLVTLFNNHKQQILYSLAGILCVASIFGVILFLSIYSDNPSEQAFPSPSTGKLSDLLQQHGQVQGAQTQQEPQPVQQSQPVGPEPPLPAPSVAKVSPTPSPSALPSHTPTPTPSPSPSPTSTPDNNPNPTPTPTPVPSAPGNLQGNAGCNSSTPKVNLTWDSVSNALSYKVYRNGQVVSSNSTNTSYEDPSVTASTAYLYFVRAINNTGESADSNSVNITPNSCS